MAKRAEITTLEPAAHAQAALDFGMLYESKIGSDFQLVSRDKKEFLVHRAFLIARSPIFAAMLTTSSLLSVADKCHSIDLNGETLEILLKFVYTWSSEGITVENAEKVLMAANKYGISGLKSVCEYHTLFSMSPQNSAYLLLLGSQYNLQKLITAAFDHLAEHFENFVDSGSLQHVRAYSVPLMKKLLRYYSDRQLENLDE